MSYLAILQRAYTKCFHVPGFTDSGFSFMFLVLQIPAFHVPGFTDSGLSCSWFFRPNQRTERKGGTEWG